MAEDHLRAFANLGKDAAEFARSVGPFVHSADARSSALQRAQKDEQRRLFDELLVQSGALKDQGARYFRAELFEAALQAYLGALALFTCRVEDALNSTAAVRERLAVLNANSAACCLKIPARGALQALPLAQAALKFDRYYGKALLREADALLELKRGREAMTRLQPILEGGSRVRKQYKLKKKALVQRIDQAKKAIGALSGPQCRQQQQQQQQQQHAEVGLCQEESSTKNEQISRAPSIPKATTETCGVLLPSALANLQADVHSIDITMQPLLPRRFIDQKAQGPHNENGEASRRWYEPQDASAGPTTTSTTSGRGWSYDVLATAAGLWNAAPGAGVLSDDAPPALPSPPSPSSSGDASFRNFLRQAVRFAHDELCDHLDADCDATYEAVVAASLRMPSFLVCSMRSGSTVLIRYETRSFGCDFRSLGNSVREILSAEEPAGRPQLQARNHVLRCAAVCAVDVIGSNSSGASHARAILVCAKAFAQAESASNVGMHQHDEPVAWCWTLSRSKATTQSPYCALQPSRPFRSICSPEEAAVPKHVLNVFFPQ